MPLGLDILSGNRTCSVTEQCSSRHRRMGRAIQRHQIYHRRRDSSEQDVTGVIITMRGNTWSLLPQGIVLLKKVPNRVEASSSRGKRGDKGLYLSAHLSGYRLVLHLSEEMRRSESSFLQPYKPASCPVARPVRVGRVVQEQPDPLGALDPFLDEKSRLASISVWTRYPVPEGRGEMSRKELLMDVIGDLASLLVRVFDDEVGFSHPSLSRVTVADLAANQSLLTMALHVGDVSGKQMPALLPEFWDELVEHLAHRFVSARGASRSGGSGLSVLRRDRDGRYGHSSCVLQLTGDVRLLSESGLPVQVSHYPPFERDTHLGIAIPGDALSKTTIFIVGYAFRSFQVSVWRGCLSYA